MKEVEAAIDRTNKTSLNKGLSSTLKRAIKMMAFTRRAADFAQNFTRIKITSYLEIGKIGDLCVYVYR